MKRKLEQEILDAMNRDPGNWRGPFYVNRKDPRLIVPKYSRWMGFTLNFANPFSWVVVVVLIAIIVLVSL
ncbi:DUF5808 domain-containing protein [Mangrovibacterium lignilyticum]|uniref:DUF5808 domain-containing protein n=1 Tax=Mangrovibacterium lignilyticum TaxID=2668052 RepID=UPI0013D24B6A|nr:DUF5808 domain-containing protein [Mangrovibacterium lignilyticum]